MADTGQIGLVIAVDEQHAALMKVVDDIVILEKEIDTANGKTIAIQVDLKGAETLQSILEAAKEAKTALTDLSATAKESKVAFEQVKNVQDNFSKGIVDNVEALTQQKIELQYVNGQIKAYTKAIVDGKGDQEKMNALLAENTKRQQELKVEISSTTLAIKKQIQVNQAEVDSLDEKRAQLIILQRQYDGMSGAMRSASESGKVLQGQITGLTDELKELEGATGRNQRNVGNYTKSIVDASVEIDLLRKKMADMRVETESDAKAYMTLEQQMASVKATAAGMGPNSGAMGGSTATTSGLSVAAQFNANKARLQEMTVAGQKGTAEFRLLEVETQKLGVAMREVSGSVGRATFSIENLTRRLETMGFRMLVHLTAFTLIAEAAGVLWEWVTKLSDAEEAAKNRQEEYNSSLKEYAKIVADMPANVSAGIAIDTAKEKLNVDIMTDVTQGIEARTAAYKALLSTMPGLFHGFTEEQALNVKNIDALRTHSAAIIELGNKYNETVKLRDAAQKILSNEEEGQTDLEKTYSGTLKDPNPQKTASIKEHTEAVKEYNYTISQLGQSLARINSPEIKDKKPPKDNAKEMNARLESEQKQHEINMLQIKENYTAKNNQYPDAEALHRRQMDDAEFQESKEHLEKMTLIITSYHGKVGESEAKYQERLLQQQLDLKKIEQATTEDEKNSAIALMKIHDEANKKLDEEIEKWNKLSAEIRAIDAQLDNVKAKAKIDHNAATGINPILAGMGIEGLDTSDTAKRSQDIQASQSKIDISQNAFNAETSKDLPNPEKVIGIQKEIASEKLNLAQLEADQQAAIDQKVLDGKRKVGELTVDLAQQTFSAIKTIQDNAFAAEEQQLEIKQRQLQISSQQQIAAINATTGFQVTKENEVAKVVAQTTAQQNAIQQQQNQLALKKAKADKEAAEAGVLLNTALAISKVLPVLATNPVLGAAEIALITAIGAVQYAAAASTPLPQFAGGTPEGGTWTKQFVAGEKGPELGKTPSGDVMMFNEPGIYSAPIGTQISTAEETQRLINYATNGIGYNAGSLAAMTVVQNTISTKSMEEKLDNLTDAVIQTALIGRNNIIKNNVTVNLKNPLQKRA